jgi:ketosteroid isomerase-like protein
VDWRQIEIIGYLAYEWGVNTQTISLPDHPEPVKNTGKITLVLRKQPDASWKVVLESWNGNPQPKS